MPVAALVQRARRRLHLAEEVQAGVFAFERMQLRDLLVEFEGILPEKLEGDLLVGPGAIWFRLEGNPLVDLAKHRVLPRILGALAEQHILSPGEGLSQEDLAGIGWPGERVHPEAASIRVRNAISTLRSRGLAEVLQRCPTGYRLDPKVRVVFATHPYPDES